MWAKKFATTVGPKVAVMVCNPGQCVTDDNSYHILKKTMGEYGQSLYRSLTGMRRPEEGARVALWCADSPDCASANGKYVDFGIIGPLKMHPPCEIGFSPSHNESAVSIMDSAQVGQLWTLTQKFLVWQSGHQQQLQRHDQADSHGASESLPNLLNSKQLASHQKRGLRHSHSILDKMGLKEVSPVQEVEEDKEKKTEERKGLRHSHSILHKMGLKPENAGLIEL